MKVYTIEGKYEPCSCYGVYSSVEKARVAMGWKDELGNTVYSSEMLIMEYELDSASFSFGKCVETWKWEYDWDTDKSWMAQRA